MTGAEEHRDWRAAFDEELRELHKRSSTEPAGDERIGLAFSGGGIRSATFGLGVLEALKQRGLLRSIQYLSTVSGGGYIGAWLSASCRRHPTWLDPSADWSQSVAHLRRYSNYLSPKVGFFSADTWSMFTVWIRNTLLVQITVILAIASVLMLPRPLLELFQYWPLVGDLRWLSIALFLLGVAGIAGNQIAVNSRTSVTFLQAKSWPLGLLGAAVCVALAWAYGAYLGFDPFHGGQVNYLVAAPIAALLVLAAFWLQPTAVALIGSLWRGDDPPTQINYTQGWAQAVVVLPMMATGFFVAAILWGESQSVAGAHVGLDTFEGFGQFFTTAWWYWPFPLSVVFVSLWLLSFCSVTSRKDWKGLAAAFAAPFVAVPVLHALLCLIMVVLHRWAQHPDTGLWRAFVWGPPFVLYASRDHRDHADRHDGPPVIRRCSRVVEPARCVARHLRRRLDGRRRRRGVWTAMGLLGDTRASLDVDDGGRRLGRYRARRSVRRPVRRHHRHQPPEPQDAQQDARSDRRRGAVRVHRRPADWRRDRARSDRHHQCVGSELVERRDCSYQPVRVSHDVADRLGRVHRRAAGDGRARRHQRVQSERVLPEPPGSLLSGRDAFSAGERQPQNFTGFDEDDDLELRAVGTIAARSGPLHIVNCALNLGGSSDLALHTRHSASFTLSPLHCGSSYESRDQSGEQHASSATCRRGVTAASSGRRRSARPSRCPAPPPARTWAITRRRSSLPADRVQRAARVVVSRIREESAVGLPSPHFNLRYLFTELFGGADDKSKFLMISDGGHFENLAAYELVRSGAAA